MVVEDLNYQGSIIHGFTALVDDEFSVSEERFGAITKLEANYAQIFFQIFYVFCFYQIRIPLL